MAYTIEAEGLTKTFGAAPVLDGLELTVEAGEVFALLGPNGAGKTTTVRILATLLAPDGGFARVAGHDVVAQPRAVRAAIGLTAQEAAVDELLTGAENLRMMARLRRQPRSRADELLERFDLAEAADRRVATYSGGMRRRLDIAMSLVARPQVLFLDEPTTGLDPRSRRAVWEAVMALADEGTTVLLTTQYLEEADQLADRITVIDHGRVVAEGSAEALKARVGGETLVLVFADGASRRFPVDGPEDVRRVLESVDGVERIELHRPSLDDVFLALT
ncbi:MAG TPA: ATP-binding cassette domain-containing protein [Solirubrobacter sp.]|nr:ATP-binding cassette domain-containing protein [Solirubrobacter sp.]